MRKSRTKGGGQHCISAKIDLDKWEWLKNEPNKNRIINQGLWWWKRQQQRFQEWNEQPAIEHWEKLMNKESGQY